MIIVYRTPSERKNTIGKDIKTVTVDFAVMTTNGVSCLVNDPGRIARDVRVIQERFAQANVKVVTNSVNYFPAPPIIAPTFTNWVIRTNISSSNGVLTTEAKAVIKAANPVLQGYSLIYVPFLRAVTNQNPNVTTHGSAVTEYFYNDPADASYLGNSFVSVVTDSLTPPHELGHVLRLRHTSMAWNLMRSQTSANGMLGTKRFTTNQIDTIRGNLK